MPTKPARRLKYLPMHRQDPLEVASRKWPDLPKTLNTNWFVKDFPESGTAAELGLTFMPYDTAEPWRVLPYKYKFHGLYYPLPDDISELERLAIQPLPKMIGRLAADKLKPSSYLHYYLRARKRYKELTGKDAVFHVAETAIEEAVDRNSKKLEKHMRKAEKDLAEFRAERDEALELIKAEAAKSIATMNDLFSQARAVASSIMAAYQDGRAINDKPVSTNEALNAAGKVFNMTAKIGAVDERERESAESAVLEQYLVETRRRLESQSTQPTIPDTPDGEVH